jgi:peptidylprolyl isomerase
MPSTRSLLIPALAAHVLALGACGEDEQDQTGGTQAPPATETQAAPPATETAPEATGGAAAGGNQAEAIAEQLSAEGRPRIPRPTTEPPAELQQADVKRGTGRTLREGDTVSMQYAGASWSTGQEFDASFERGQPFEFQLGAQMVIPGWDQGIPGMKVGGRRVLVIPPDLGYGPQGTPDGSIAPNETLVFVIDAEDVQR